MVGFPQIALGVKVELFINSVWTDISSLVYQRNDITITGGAPDQSQTPQPSSLTLTLDNRDGRFSPLNSTGVYYPYLLRDVQIRVSVNSQSSTGVAYSGYRFWGKVHRWPPISDITGKDVTVDIAAQGPLRQILQSGGQDSALARYYQNLTGNYIPIAYWPCEEDLNSTLLGPGLSGGTGMTVTGGNPVFKAVSNFNGSAPIGVVNGSTWTGLTNSFGASGDDVFNQPGTYQWISGVSSVNVIVTGSGGGGGWQGAFGGGGGGGGECAQEATLAVTVGQVYTVVVPSGGTGGALNTFSTDGQATTFSGNAVTVTAHGGTRGQGAAAGAGGTGSANTVHHPGGAGFYQASSATGGGGGASGTPTATGFSATSATGASPQTGGGPGGDGAQTGTSTRSFTNTYYATDSYAYEGNDGHQPNQQLNHNGAAYQGGDNANTYNGHTKSWIKFDTTTIQSDLSGATITKVRVRLTNEHSWFNTGMTVALGYDLQTVFGSTKADPVTGGNTFVDVTEYSISEGASKVWHDVSGAGFGTAFQNGNANCLLLYKNTNTLTYYGYFTGANQSSEPALEITFTKSSTGTPNGDSPSSPPGGGGGGSLGSGFAGGNGASGQIELIYTPAVGASANYTRFIMFVPPHGGVNNSVLVRIMSGGTVAQLDVIYQTGGNVIMKGYNNVSTLLFTTGALATNVDNTTLLVSAELANSGANIGWRLACIKPGVGQGTISLNGTLTSASCGNVSEVIVGPNSDVTKTAIGHISVQYGFVWLEHIAAALDGHHTELSIDRFIRICTEQGMTGLPDYLEKADHWGFEDGTVQGWTATNGALTNSAVTNPAIVYHQPAWPYEGTKSLLMTCNGVGAPSWTSPIGLSGQPCLGGDTISASLEIYTPTAIASMVVSLNFYDQNANFLSGVSTTVSTTAGLVRKIQVTTDPVAGAPAGSTYFAVAVSNAAVLANGKLIYIDNVRTSPQMGPQTRRIVSQYLHDIKNLETGLLREAREAFGMHYVTRVALLNQTPTVTLDYSLAQISDVLEPVVDDLHTIDTLTVRHLLGSKVTVSAVSSTDSGTVISSKNKSVTVIAAIDNQLLNIANELLNRGQATDERYPSISVDLARVEVAALFNSIASVEVGDFVKIINLPFWYPNQTAKQLVTGYSEQLNTYKWTIQWNCVPESPYEIVSSNMTRW